METFWPLSVMTLKPPCDGGAREPSERIPNFEAIRSIRPLTRTWVASRTSQGSSVLFSTLSSSLHGRIRSPCLARAERRQVADDAKERRLFRMLVALHVERRDRVRVIAKERPAVRALPRQSRPHDPKSLGWITESIARIVRVKLAHVVRNLRESVTVASKRTAPAPEDLASQFAPRAKNEARLREEPRAVASRPPPRASPHETSRAFRACERTDFRRARVAQRTRRSERACNARRSSSSTHGLHSTNSHCSLQRRSCSGQR